MREQGHYPWLKLCKTSISSLIQGSVKVIRRIRALLKTETAPCELFDLNEAVRECIVMVNSAPLLDRLSIKGETDRAQLLVRADHVQLQQVLFNLIANASGAGIG